MSGGGKDRQGPAGAGEALRQLVHDAPVAIVVSVEERFAYLNSAAVRLFGGISPDELIGRDVMAFIRPERQTGVQERGAAALLSGHPASSNVQRLVRLDGSEFIGEVLGGPTTFRGQPALQAVIRDVTEQRRAEDVLHARLRLSEYALTHTLDELLDRTLDEAESLTGSRIGFFHFLEDDQETLSLQSWSTATRRICSTDAHGLHYPLSQAGVWADCIRDRRPVIHNDCGSLAHRHGLPEGHVPVRREMVVPVFRGERIVAVLGVGNREEEYGPADVEIVSQLANLAWDIVLGKRVEESLRNSKRHYQELYRLLRLMCDNVPDLIWAKDMAQRYIFVNRAMCEKLLGAVDTDEPVGRDDMFFAGRERTAHADRPDWHTFGELCRETDTIVMESGQAGRIDEYGNVKGEFLFLDVSKAPFRDERGEMIGTVGCGRDVTEVKRLEQERLLAEGEVRRLNERLEHLVAERTAELQQANRDLTSFCYAISHELRGPIARLQGFSEMLGESLPGDVEQALFFARRIAAASDQLQQVTDAVLHLSRVSRSELSLRTVDLSVLAGAVVGMLRGSIAERRVEVVIEPGLSVTGDPDLLKLCLENLLGNAIKYSSRRSVARIEFGRDPATGAFFVRDNGAGFDMTYAGKLFMPFQRLHCQDEFPGTGIGLATVQRIVERHGGRVWATGVVDGGATFYFSLGTGLE